MLTVDRPAQLCSTLLLLIQLQSTGGRPQTTVMPLEFELCPGRMIGGSHPCFIIAEIGQNHQGDIEMAKKMIKMAKVTTARVRPKVQLIID